MRRPIRPHPVRRRPVHNRKRATHPIEAIVGDARDAVCFLDYSAHRIYVNDALRRVCPTLKSCGYATDEHLLASFKRALRSCDVCPIQIEQIAHDVASPYDRLVARNITVKDKTFEIRLNPLERPRGVFLLWRDVTHELEEKRRKDTFLAELSHDFKTPLTAIHGYTELLLTRAESAKTSRMLTQVKQETERLERLVTNFLAYQKGIYADEPLVWSDVPVKELFQELAAYYQETTSHHIVYTTPELTIRADAHQLRQLLHNLMENAIHYSPDGGPITLEATCSENQVALSVKDEGIGIPEQAIPFVFDEYYRVESEAHQSIKGTGLGLRICQRIAEAHGWSMHVDSTYGQGTTFTIELHLD